MESKCSKTVTVKRRPAGIKPSALVILQEERPERREQTSAQQCWYAGGKKLGPREVICTRTLKPEREKMGKTGEINNF